VENALKLTKNTVIISNRRQLKEITPFIKKRKEGNKMQRSNKDLIENARSANLADYFSRSGYHLEKHGNELYVKEIQGLCVNEKTHSWYHHYSNQGGRNSIDCLTKVLGQDFKSAVSELSGNSLSYSKIVNSDNTKQKNSQPTPKYVPAEKEIKELQIPERSENMKQLFAYFIQTRKIPAEIVTEFVKNKLLYQSQNTVTCMVNDIPQTFKNNNAVFLHKDENGSVVGAEVQGLNSYKRFKGVATGTRDSVFSYVPVPAKDGKVKKAYLFESGIDLMSFYTFCNKKKLEGVALISMAGLKPTVPKKMQAEGVEIFSCVDNDEAGRKFEQENGFKRAGGAILEKAGVKDWNDCLKKSVATNDKNLVNVEKAVEEDNVKRGR
jgi:hypothetical protein